jgi:predicted HicB family RNase H-like nuclease
MKREKPETTTMHRLTVRLPDELVQRAKLAAVKGRTTLQRMIAQALENSLKQSKGDQS